MPNAKQSARVRARIQPHRPTRRWAIALLPVGLVIAIVAVLIAVKLTSGSSPGGAPGPARSPLAATVGDQITTVSESTLDTVGVPDGVHLPTRVASAPALASGGRPEVLYVGAEYCPFCAAERWALTEALSRFGTFTHLSATRSSSSDTDPDTPTLSYFGSTFASRSVVFQPVETTTNQPEGDSYRALETPTGAEAAVMAAYDRSPYAPSSGGIPFIDIGNRWIINGASYDPSILAGQTQASVAAAMGDPSTTIAQLVDGTANVITAAVCDITGGQPLAVCDTPAVTAGHRQLATQNPIP
jgi:hypothetical protein